MRDFTRRNLLLLCLVVLGVLGLGGALLLREHSFPVATVNFRLLAPDAERAARAYLAERGFDLTGYQSAVAFEVDDAAKDYIDRQDGLAALNRLAADNVAVWRWHVRFFRELQEEEFSVYLSPDGRLVGFSHTVPETTPGANLALAQAQKLAEQYVAQSGRDLSAYRLVSATAQKREARTDHFFTWEDKSFKVGEATYRFDVWVYGDGVAGYYEYLKVPETWLRARALEANRGSLLALIGWTLTYALGLAMAFICLLRLRAGRVRWRFALALAALLALVGIATAVNSLPTLLMQYPTTSTMSAYLVGRVQSLLTSSVPSLVAVVMAGVAGDWLYGAILLRRLPPHALFSRAGLASKEFATAVAAGYAVAGIWLGYVTSFYTVAGGLVGAWSPAEVPYSDLMSTLLPGLYPLTVGFSAALGEEFTFRLFAVPFFLWLGWAGLRRWPGLERRPALYRALQALLAVLAVVVPAAIWGTLHSTYPQQPFYIRAVEIGIVGSFSALLMVRFGIAATVTSHYVYNASVIGGLFLLSSSPYLWASAVVVVLLPAAVVGLGALWRARGLAPATLPAVAEPLPALVGAGRPAAAPAPAAAWAPGRGRLWALAAVGVVCLALAVAWSVPRLGDGLRLGIDRDQAKTQADALMRDLGLAPETWQSATTFADWSLGNPTAYLLRRLGTAATSRFLQDDLPSYVWQTRYFRPLQREEISVRFDQEGRLHSFDRTLPEDAPGDHLTREQAQVVAEAFVRAYGRGDALAGQLVTASSVERKARTDYIFEWEDRAHPIGEAYFRLRVTVQGGAVGQYITYLKIPEAFDRALAKRTAAGVGLDLARDAMQTAILVVVVVLFVLRFRRGRLGMRFAAGATGLMVALAVLAKVDDLPNLFSDYWTTIEPAGFVVWQATAWLSDLGGRALWYFALFAVMATLFRERFAGELAPGDQLRALLRGGRASLATGLFALAFAPLAWVVLAAYRALREAVALGSLGAEGTVPSGLVAAAWPAVGAAGNNLSFSLWVVLGATAITLWLWRTLRRPWLVAVVWVAGLTLLYAGRLEEWQRLLVEAGRWAVVVGIAYVAATRFVGPNLVAYVLALYTFFAVRDALFFLGQPQPFYAAQALAALVLALLPAVFFVVIGLARKEVRDERAQEAD